MIWFKKGTVTSTRSLFDVFYFFFFFFSVQKGMLYKFQYKKKKENEQSRCLSEKLYCVRSDKKRIIHWWWWWGLHAEALEQRSGRGAPITSLIAICGRKVEFKWVMKQSYGISGVCEAFLQAESLKNSIILFFVAKEEQHLILWVSPERLN